jgi:hypothetical protein
MWWLLAIVAVVWVWYENGGLSNLLSIQGSLPFGDNSTSSNPLPVSSGDPNGGTNWIDNPTGMEGIPTPIAPARPDPGTTYDPEDP